VTVRHLAPNSLTFHRYHGNGKETDVLKLIEFDIILTTYATIIADFSRVSRLHQIMWYRIVLDEGNNNSLANFH